MPDCVIDFTTTKDVEEEWGFYVDIEKETQGQQEVKSMEWNQKEWNNMEYPIDDSLGTHMILKVSSTALLTIYITYLLLVTL
jgi:hypothetical protein